MKHRYSIRRALTASALLAVSLLGAPLVTDPAARVEAGNFTVQMAAPDVATLPNAFAYQGTLRLADGSLATGPYTMTLRVYTTVIGGTPLFTETFGAVVVRNGSFSIVVGDAVAMPPSLFDNAQLYLGLTVAPDPEQLPRQRLFPVRWAMQAGAAKTA